MSMSVGTTVDLLQLTERIISFDEGGSSDNTARCIDPNLLVHFKNFLAAIPQSDLPTLTLTPSNLSTISYLLSLNTSSSNSLSSNLLIPSWSSIPLPQRYPLIRQICENHISESRSKSDCEEAAGEMCFPKLLDFLTGVPAEVLQTHNEELTALLATANLSDLNYAYLLDSISPSASDKEKKSQQQPKSSSSASSHNNNKNNLPPPQSLKDIRITQLSQIFPSLGLGYLELALACYSNSVESTVSALSDPDPSTLHRRLLGVDPNLPLMRRESEKQYTKLTDESVKKYVVSLEKEEERKAQLFLKMSEYDDDYDDQYDDSGGIVDDYAAVMEYNRGVKESLSEDGFWNEMRNKNKDGKKSRPRQGKKGSDGEDDGEDVDAPSTSKTFGPDKGKGGRLLGPDGKYLPLKKNKKKVQQQQNSNPTSSAKSGNASQTTTPDGEMTKLQKRRKDANKAKRANHNRKDRALKKVS
ncbi:hypothetical protein TrVE_jg8537 [Triparma verrucosa]|uniref:CUE domain-containing protein n=1 Tax=Triparma verrucosa TaxID=1606542 RepID=A0A9W7KU94_9STRA|nr:hypothetical protein TrVE_jg8537 [Triparma verrucosa]